MTLLLIEIRKLESRMLKNFSFQIKRTHSSGWQKSAIENQAGQYNPVTGLFEWMPKD